MDIMTIDQGERERENGIIKKKFYLKEGKKEGKEDL
jgi:hypothetical protein